MVKPEGKRDFFTGFSTLHPKPLEVQGRARGKRREFLPVLAFLNPARQAQLRQVQQQLQEQLDQVSALREVEASQRRLLAEHEERIHLLEMERRRLHNDIQELKVGPGPEGGRGS